jgi:hypothetical protein
VLLLRYLSGELTKNKFHLMAVGLISLVVFMKQCIFIILLLSISFYSRSQNIGIGADVMYNFQTESVGAGARVNFFPNNRLSIVPQFAYYFPFNKINEYYLGLGLEYKVIRREKINFYVLAHGAYNKWINYKESPMVGAKPNNWNLEGGIGISNNKCLRPFLEYRYNVMFRETHLRLGILYIFGCKPGASHTHERCAAYS